MFHKGAVQNGSPKKGLNPRMAPNYFHHNLLIKLVKSSSYNQCEYSWILGGIIHWRSPMQQSTMLMLILSVHQRITQPYHPIKLSSNWECLTHNLRFQSDFQLLSLNYVQPNLNLPISESIGVNVQHRRHQNKQREIEGYKEIRGTRNYSEREKLLKICFLTCSER